MNKQTIGIVLSIVALAVSIGGYFHVVVPSFGGITNYNELDADVLRIGGTSGTRLAYINTGTCSLIASSFTVAATTTQAMDCAITGVVSTDGVFAQFATSTTATAIGGWQIRGASASTTAGFITMSVVNGTGASAVIPASIASTTKYIILRGTTSATGL